MTKYKTTTREQKENNCCIISAGYCELQNITRFLTPEAYTSGVYGWSSDIYKLSDGVILSTGYNYINTWGYSKEWKKRAEMIEIELFKIEKRIKSGVIKTSGNYPENKKKIKKIIEKMIDRISEKIPLY